MFVNWPLKRSRPDVLLPPPVPCIWHLRRQGAVLQPRLVRAFLRAAVDDGRLRYGGPHGPVGKPALIEVGDWFAVEAPFVTMRPDVLDQVSFDGLLRIPASMPAHQSITGQIALAEASHRPDSRRSLSTNHR